MKLSRKNKSLYNQSMKRPISNTNKNKNINLFPLFIQITKKGSQHSKLKDEEISLGVKNKNLNINNISNNNNNNHVHSNSSLYINFFSPVHNPHFFQNQKNKSNVQSIINDSQKNNNMVLTSVDNSSAIGSKEKILAYNQNNNNLLIQNKNKNNKKYPKTALNSRKNSVDKKRNNKSLFQKCQKVYSKNSVNLNSNRNRIFQSNNNVKTYSNKNLLSKNNNNNNSKIKLGESNFNNYIKNSKLQKNLANNKKNHLQNLTNFLYNNNYNNNFGHKKNVSITHTAKISPAASFINTNSKSLKSINNIKNNSKINEIINNGEKVIKNNFIENNNENKLNKKKNSNNNTNFNSVNNFYNILNNNNNPNINNNNNNNNYINSNIENILNNCQTTSCGAFYNNYNININNLINNHIIYNNNINNNFNHNNNNSRKKLNLANLVNNKKISRIISQSQQEILQIKKNAKKHFTSNNSPNRLFNYKIASSTKKIKNNKNNNLNNKKNNFLFSYNNNLNNNNIINNNNKNTNTNIKIFNNLRNISTKKSTKKIKSKSTEKLNMQIKSFKDELTLNLNLNENENDINYKNNGEEKLIKVNHSKLNSYDKLNNIRKSKSSDKNKNIESNIQLEETHKKNNIYMESSLSLTDYIRNYYKKNKKYPNTNLTFYKYGRLIGQGAFGKVNLGLNVLTGRVVAIKSFNKKNFDTKTDFMKKIIYETNLMKKLNHKNITKILEMFEDDKYILIIMEYINGGNLFSFVKKRRKLSEKISKFLFKQIILGLQHIHSHNIVHRDVKLENILIDLNNTIKICDFGIGRVLSNPDDLLYDQCGTPMYMAPEILFSTQDKGYKGFPVDIWSAGIALYIMLSGTLPFSVKKEDSLNDNKNKKKNWALKQAIMYSQPKKIEKISDKAKDLLHGLLNKDPNKRLTIDEILNHPWLKEDENDLKNNNNKYHLFTKAEMIMLSKTYTDYRKTNMEDLQENFTISNLKRENDIKTLKNVTTKSFILTPYNSIIEEDENSLENNDIFNSGDLEDINNSQINLENDLISLDNKVKEFNMLYELNNNKEVDNGMLINSKINTNTNSLIVNDLNENSQVKTESVICFEEEGNINDDKKIVIENNDEINEQKKEEKILEKIERMGYDKKYVKECLENNVLCQATAAYFLLMNYDNI